MAMNGVKMEIEPQIKQDPESFTPGGFMDDDLYEDTGELNMPPRHTADIWLTRVPKWLWESLATAGDDEEIEVGKIAMWDDAHGNSRVGLDQFYPWKGHN
jgi:transcription initiation factor TFIIF subunit beta